METSPLKQFVFDLSSKAEEMKATPAAMLAAMVKCILADEPMPDARAAFLCNVSQRTIKNSAEQIEQLVAAMKAYDLTKYGSTTITPPQDYEVPEDYEVQYPEDFNLFLKCYPNHGAHRITSKNYQKTLLKHWCQLEYEGYTGEDIIRIFIEKRYSTAWQAPNADIPPAWIFLSNIVYRFYPSRKPRELSPEKLAQFDPNYIEFCTKYPLPTDLSNAALYDMWQERIQQGITHQEMLHCITCCKDKPEWQKESGRYIPNALKWLTERHYTNYLPYVRDLMRAPRGGDCDEFRSDDAIYFLAFCQIYPGRTGDFFTEENFHIWEAWKICERSKTSYDKPLSGRFILRRLKSAIEKCKWNDKNKHNVPHASAFLDPKRMGEYAGGFRETPST